MRTTLAEQRESTRGLLARTIILVVVLLACVVVSLAFLQRPLGIGSDVLARAERILGALLVLAWPVTRFYFRGEESSGPRMRKLSRSSDSVL